MGLPFDGEIATKLARLEGEILAAGELIRTGIAIISSLLAIIMGFVGLLYKNTREDIAILRKRDHRLAEAHNRAASTGRIEPMNFED